MASISREELLARLKAIGARQWPNGPHTPRPEVEEGDHRQADSLLLAYINDEEISSAYSAIERWYA